MAKLANFWTLNSHKLPHILWKEASVDAMDTPQSGTDLSKYSLNNFYFENVHVIHLKSQYIWKKN